MAVTLYFLFSSITYLIPFALYSTYMIAFSVFLIFSSKQYNNEYQNKKLLEIAAIINIISVVALIFIPVNFTTSGSIPDDQRTLLYIMYYTLASIVAYVPRIFSFGVTFLIYGYRNQDRSGNYLLLTGIFWLIFTTWAALGLFSPFYGTPGAIYLLDYLFPFVDFYAVVILLQLVSVGGIFSVLGGIFLLIHSFIHKDQNLKIAGFIYLVGTAIVSLGLIPQYLELI
jgi:hypothetical protein